MLGCQVLIKKLLQIKQKTSIENDLKQIKTFDSSYFIGKSYSEEDCTQNNVVFQSSNRYFKIIANTKYISLW